MLKKIVSSDERGGTLLFALIILGIGAVLLPAFLAHTSTNLFASEATEGGILEYYTADAAIEYTLWKIKCDPFFASQFDVGEWHPTISLDAPVCNETVPVTITQLSSAGGSNEVDAVLVMDCSGSMADDGNGCTPPSCDNQAACEGAGGVWDSEEGCTLPDYYNETACENACCGSECGVWGPQPITSAKVAAKAFVDILENYSDSDTHHQAGLVSYSTNATLAMTLTTNYPAVRDAIDDMQADGYTGIGDAIAVATRELQEPPTGHGRGTAVKAIVLLSDGLANVCPEGYGTCCSDPEAGCYHINDCYGPCGEYAQAMADTACYTTTGGINFFTIALGDSADTDLMKYIARFDESKAHGCEPGNGVDLDAGETPDFYQESPSSDDLREKFESIALYLTTPQYHIVATAGHTTLESKVQHQYDEEENRLDIFTWLMTE